MIQEQEANMKDLYFKNPVIARFYDAEDGEYKTYSAEDP